jgi:cytochrome c-type biogenesis protein CcmF
MVVHKNPFTIPHHGGAGRQGLNPLLQNYWMAIHPPSLYTSFVGMTIPFFHRHAHHRAPGRLVAASCALDDGQQAIPVLRPDARDDLGLQVLGWGGYWGWIRSSMACCRGSQPPPSSTRSWCRAGHAARLERRARDHDVLPDDLRDVHDAFGRGAVGARLRRGRRTGAPVHRLHGGHRDVQLRPGHLPAAAAEGAQRTRLWISREAAFLVNNWILLFSAFFILFATMFPTLSEAVTGNRIAVAQPFFNKWMLPMASSCCS